MIIILVPLLVALVGLLMYAFAANVKLQNIGLVMFGVGLYWAVHHVSGREFRV